MFKPYYRKGDFCLYHGNCLDVLESVPADSVDMIFADPPYNLSNGGFSVHSGKQVDVYKGNWDQSRGIEKDFAFHLSWIKACRRVLKPEGTLWISGTYHSIYQCGFALQTLGYRILNDITWYKPNASPNIGCRCFAASHETLIWASKEEKSKYTFHYKDMKFGLWNRDFIKKPEKQMRSVWAINTPLASEKTAGKHPTQKPLDLLIRVLKASTNKKDVVLDPFTGSSTTGIAAHRLGRSFIGIDSHSPFLDLSIKRLKAESQPMVQLELSP